VDYLKLEWNNMIWEDLLADCENDGTKLIARLELEADLNYHYVGLAYILLGQEE